MTTRKCPDCGIWMRPLGNNRYYCTYCRKQFTWHPEIAGNHVIRK